MTQTRWRITTALLLSALVVGVSRGEDPAPEKAPTKDCPLSKILYINRLFKNVSAPPSTPAAACPCKPGKPCDGCCCSDHASKPATTRCCPVTGVCCPPNSMTPACVPPPPPAAPVGMPCTLPAPVAIPVPPVGMGPFPPMPMPPVGMYPAVPPPPPDCGDYLVELKVMESRPGEEERLVAQPQMMVVAGQPASLCCPLSEFSCSSISSALPLHMIGEQGIDVCVIRAGHHGRVLLDVIVHKVEQHSKDGKCYVERTSAVRMCKQVKLGKTVKLPCEVPTTGEKVHCRIEATVKEASLNRDLSVCAPPPVMPPCAEPCPCPKPMDAPVCGPVAPVDCCIPAPTPCRTEPEKKHFTKMTLRVVQENGKSRLKMENGTVSVLCEKTVLQLHDCRPVEVTIMGKQVSLSFDSCGRMLTDRYVVKMKADRVSTAPHGCLILEGHVHLEGAGDEDVIEIQGGKVRLQLPGEFIQTGVISSPTLVQ